MKTIKRIYKWILFSVVMQVIVLSYINFIYLPNRGAITATTYTGEEVEIKNRSVRLPTGAENITVTNNGLYAAYSKDGDIIITNLDKRKEIKKLTPGAGSYSFFRWLPDRDMLIYALNEPDGNKGQVKISTYDIDADLERSYPEIKGLPEGSEVTDIVLSPFTNIVYTMIKTGESTAKIYKFNIMDKLTYIMTVTPDTVIKETLYSDYLVYQKKSGKITMRNGKNGKSGTFSRSGKYLLLDTDGEDRVYAGKLDEGGRITGIVFGKIDVKHSNWETVELNDPVEKDDIFITPSGNIYINDDEDQSVTLFDYRNNVVENITYNGKLLEINDNYLIILKGSRLETVKSS